MNEIQEQMFHACRVAFSCGAENVPWHMMLHALRQGLGLKGTYTLQEKDYKEYPQLRELMDYLKAV